MIEQLNIYGKNKVEVAIERLKLFEPEEGYYLAFSGGKDSVVVKALADMAGVKYDAHYSHTSVDPPELIQYIKDVHPDVLIDYPRYKDGTRITMWNLIPKKKMPPTRIVRYCCAELKESGGDGRFTITGARWDESAKRKNNQGIVTVYKAGKEFDGNSDFQKNISGGVVLTNDNSESRQLIDTCYQRKKTVLNPIIDWTTEEVWEFIRKHDIPYCKLYDDGYKRLGCIGCPMSNKNAEELERHPKYKKAYLSAFGRMLEIRKENGLKCGWETPEDVMNWWLRK